MNRALVPLASVLVLAATLTVALAHPPAILSEREEKETAEEIKDFRKTVARAIQRKDTAALRKIYFKGYTHTHVSGAVENQEKRIAAVLTGEPVIETAPTSELVIRVPGGWTAVATGVSQIRSAADDKTHAVRWTSVYVRMGESWQIAAGHESRAGEAR